MRINSVNQPVLVLTEIPNDGGISFPMNSNEDSLVTDILNSLYKNTPNPNTYNVTPIDNGSCMNYSKLSKEDEIKALEDALSEAKELEKEIEDQLEKAKLDKTDVLVPVDVNNKATTQVSETKQEKEAVAVAEKKDETASVPEKEAETASVSEPEKEAETASVSEPASEEKTDQSTEKFSSNETFENLLGSSSLTYFLLVILLLLFLFLLNNHYKFIKF